MAYTTIDDPSAYFQTKLYTGNLGDNRAITNDGNSDLQPDWIWFKNRNTTNSHNVLDSTRGIGKKLEGPDNTNVEGDTSTRLTSFDSNGFTVRTDPSVNGDGNGIVAWQWKANGGTVANDTNGDITTSVQASQTAGFSIATYTGNGGSGQTLGHGLGAEADIVIFKDRESTSAWRIYVRLLGASKFLNLNTNDGAGSSTNVFPSASSTTIGVEQNDVMNKNNSDFVMYSFRSIKGYSKIGKYVGNGSTDGPFIFTGFKPAWVMTKRTDSGGDWAMMDHKRPNEFNVVQNYLKAQANDAEQTDDSFNIDIVSNGFKIRYNNANYNADGGSYIYIAFAEHPLVSSKGVPTTAR